MQNRRARILKVIRDDREASIEKLQALFPDVSSMTIRRDLEYLEQQGEVVRVKGGAKSVSMFLRRQEGSYEKREQENYDEKREIARKAARLVEGAKSIYLDPGTTVMQLAKELVTKDLFVTTSGPNIAMEMMKNPGSTVNIVGGELNRENIALAGFAALEFVDSINIELAFIAASGFSAASGFTCGNHAECLLKKRIIQKASRVVVLMDSSKDGVNLPYTFAAPSDVDVFVSDQKLDAATAEYIRTQDVTII